MFRKLHKSKKVEIRCPHCGHRQDEPAQVISSFCRDCGEYFRVKSGVAVATPGLRVSGINDWDDPRGETADSSNQPVELPAIEALDTEAEESWQVTAEEADNGAQRLESPGESEEEESVGISAGAFFGFVDEEEGESDSPPKRGIGQQAQSRDALAEGSMEALIQSQIPREAPKKERMPPNYVPPEKRKKLVDASSDIAVRCYRCYHVQSVSRYAKSTQCERCSVYISLANYEIKSPKKHTVRTRGDVTIGRKGALRDCEIACHHLTVNGPIDAYVDCSGDAVFRKSGTVRGNLYCRKILIERNCVVEFPDGVMADRAEIQGKLVGDLTCSGKVRLGRSAVVTGTVTAIDLEQKEGAEIGGETVLDPGTTTALPVKAGFNPTIIG